VESIDFVSELTIYLNTNEEEERLNHQSESPGLLDSQ
jgi:hypothetical protein